MNVSPPSRQGPRLTRVGVVWGLALGLSIPAALTAAFWAPHSSLADLVSTSRGRGNAVVAIGAIFILTGYVLEKLGYPMIHQDDEWP